MFKRDDSRVHFGNTSKDFQSGVFRHLTRLFFGFDVFISYSRGDGLDIARMIEMSLNQRGFFCFRDDSQMPVGVHLTPYIARNLKRSRKLLIVGTSLAVKSEWVNKEIDLFLDHKRGRQPQKRLKHCYLIDVADSIADNIWGMGPDFLRIIVKEKKPEISIIEEAIASIESSYSFTRRQTLTHRLVITAVFLLLLLGAGMFWQGMEAKHQAELSRDQLITGSGGVLARKDPTTSLLLLREVGNTASTFNWKKTVTPLLFQPIASMELPFLAQWVQSTVFSRDGSSILALNENGRVLRYPLDDPSNPSILFSDKYNVDHAYFSPDGNRLLTTGAIPGKALLHLIGGENRVIDLPTDQLIKATFSHDGQYLGLVTRQYVDNSYHAAIMNIGDGKMETIAIQDHPYPLHVTFAAAGNRGLILSATRIDVLSLRQAQADAVATLNMESDITVYSFRPDGLEIAFLDKSGHLSVLSIAKPDIPERRIPDKLQNERFSGLQYSFNSKQLVLTQLQKHSKVEYGYYEGIHTVDLVDFSSHPFPVSIGSEVQSASQSQSGRYLIAVTDDESVNVWDRQQDRADPILHIANTWNGQQVHSALLNSRESHLLVLSVFGQGRTWLIDQHPDNYRTYETGMHEAACEDGDDETLVAAFFLDDGNTVVAIKYEGLIQSFQLDTGARLTLYSGPACQEISRAVAINSEKTMIMAGFWGNMNTTVDGRTQTVKVDRLRLIEMRTGTVVAEKELSAAPISGTFNPVNASRMILGLKNGALQICALNRQELTCRTIVTMSQNGDIVWSTVYSPDGKFIAASSGVPNNRIVIIDADTEKIVHDGHLSGKWPCNLAFVRSGIVVGTTGGFLYLFPFSDFQNPIYLGTQNAKIWSITADEEGETVFVTSGYGKVWRWRLDGLGAIFKFQVDAATAIQLDYHPASQSLLVATDENNFVVWGFSDAQVKKVIDDLTPICLFPDQRQTLMGETRKNAVKGFLACERRHKRNTVYSPGIHCYPERTSIVPLSIGRFVPKTVGW